MTATISLSSAAPTARAAAPPSASLFAVGDPICFTKPGNVDLCVYRGDSGRVRVRLSDSLGDPIDISLASWDCDFRASVDDPTVLCSLDVEPVSGEPNAVDIVLTAEDSATLDNDCVWDLEMTLDGGTTTLLVGAVTVTKDVSRP